MDRKVAGLDPRGRASPADVARPDRTRQSEDESLASRSACASSSNGVTVPTARRLLLEDPVGRIAKQQHGRRIQNPGPSRRPGEAMSMSSVRNDATGPVAARPAVPSRRPPRPVLDLDPQHGRLEQLEEPVVDAGSTRIPSAQQSWRRCRRRRWGRSRRPSPDPNRRTRRSHSCRELEGDPLQPACGAAMICWPTSVDP